LRMEECSLESASATSVWCHGEAEIIALGCTFSNSVNAGVIIADGATGEFTSCRFERIAASAVVIRTGATPWSHL